MFACLECGHKFRAARRAELAALEGCPECGGTDINIDPALPALPSWEIREAREEDHRETPVV